MIIGVNEKTSTWLRTTRSVARISPGAPMNQILTTDTRPTIRPVRMTYRLQIGGWLATRKNIELHRNLRFSDASDGPGNTSSESSSRFCSRIIRMSVYYFHVLRENLKEVHISITCNYERSTPLICASQDMK